MGVLHGVPHEVQARLRDRGAVLVCQRVGIPERIMPDRRDLRGREFAQVRGAHRVERQAERVRELAFGRHGRARVRGVGVAVWRVRGLGGHGFERGVDRVSVGQGRAVHTGGRERRLERGIGKVALRVFECLDIKVIGIRRGGFHVVHVVRRDQVRLVPVGVALV